jgi:HlyD family secretion protein
MNKYQIESNVPEADVSKIKVGDPATVTLDAYGPDVTWNAVVSQIYPSESVIEGVPTYKTIFTLSQNDDRIKPGMTANLDISNDNRQNVLFLPQRTIIRENGNKYVQLLSADGVHSTQVQIQTGLYGSDGKVEILSGVQEGDKIITD